jgi:streptogramin lyase
VVASTCDSATVHTVMDKLGRVFGRYVIALVAALSLLGISGAAAATQSIVEFSIPTANSSPYGITTGLDGNVWFTEETGGKIGRIEPNGKITEFPVPGGSLRNIAMGPHGYLWFTAAWGIGQIKPNGVVTTFPQASTTLQGVTAGPDQKVWVVDKAGWIDRFLTTGQLINHFPFPGTCCDASAGNITAGPDGNLWAAEIEPGGPPEVDHIARVTVSGSRTDFGSLPAAEVQGIASGWDGNLWFTAAAGDYVGRITPAGQIDTFGLTAGSAPAGIAPGTDGSVWFAEQAGRIGQVTPAGEVTEFDLPGGSTPYGVTAGADGNIWFVDRSANAIGRLSTAATNTAHVLSFDGGFVPKAQKASLGGTVQWTFFGPSVHRVQDKSGLGLFDSGSHSFVSSYSTTLSAAGTYKFKDPLVVPTVDPNGKVSVPVVASPAKGPLTTSFAVTWATAAPAPGFVFDVQIQRPGAGYVAWLSDTTGTSASFVPDAGLGTYKFRARLRESASGKATDYSPDGTIKVK